MGDAIVQELACDGVDTTHVLRPPNTSSPFTYIIVDQTGGCNKYIFHSIFSLAHVNNGTGGTRTCIHTPGPPYPEQDVTSERMQAILHDAMLLYSDGRHTPAAVRMAQAARCARVASPSSAVYATGAPGYRSWWRQRAFVRGWTPCCWKRTTSLPRRTFPRCASDALRTDARTCTTAVVCAMTMHTGMDWGVWTRVCSSGHAAAPATCAVARGDSGQAVRADQHMICHDRRHRGALCMHRAAAPTAPVQDAEEAVDQLLDALEATAAPQQRVPDCITASGLEIRAGAVVEGEVTRLVRSMDGAARVRATERAQEAAARAALARADGGNEAMYTQRCEEEDARELAVRLTAVAAADLQQVWRWMRTTLPTVRTGVCGGHNGCGGCVYWQHCVWARQWLAARSGDAVGHGGGSVQVHGVGTSTWFAHRGAALKINTARCTSSCGGLVVLRWASRARQPRWHHHIIVCIL